MKGMKLSLCVVVLFLFSGNIAVAATWSGMWTSGTDGTGSLIGVSQYEQQINAVYIQPSSAAIQAGFKGGDPVFYGTLSGQTLTGKVHQRCGATDQARCPSACGDKYNDMTMTLSSDGNTLQGQYINFTVSDSCVVTNNTAWTPITLTRHDYGNVNGDYRVDLADTILALRISAGISVSQTINLNADVNGDKKIGIGEAIYILQKVAGLRFDGILMVGQITDTRTSIGHVVIDEGKQEVLGISGVKDSSGKLTSLTGVTLASATDKNRWTNLTLDPATRLPKTIDFPDGTQIRFANYTGTTVELSSYNANGKLLKGPVIQPFDSSSLKNLRDDNSKLLDNLIWAGSQAFATAMLAAEVSAVVAGVSVVAPELLIFAGASIVVSGILKMAEAAYPDDPIVRFANNTFGDISTVIDCATGSVGGCLIGLGTKVYEMTKNQVSSIPISWMGIWVSDGGSEHGISQNGQQINGYLTKPSASASSQYGWNAGDPAFYGTLSGKTMTGTIYLHYLVEYKSLCPAKWSSSSGVTMTMSSDGKTISGNFTKNMMDKNCVVTGTSSATVTYTRQ